MPCRNISRGMELAMGKEARTMSSIRHHQAHLIQERGYPPRSTGDSTREHTLSIIVPAKDEAANLPGLVEEVIAVFRPLVGRTDRRHRLDAFELLIVDDGSTDDSAQVIDRLSKNYREVRSVTLANNVGQSAATLAGFRAARGDWVGLLDADLQNPPTDLAALWEVLPGFDAALGWRKTREDVWTKRVISRWANRVRNAVLGQSIRDTGCSIRIFPRDVSLRLPMFRGSHRFFGPLLIREGCRIVQNPVGHRPRGAGKSHYHFGNRSLRVVVDLLGVAWLMRRPVRFEVVEPSVAPRSTAQRRELSGVEGVR
ncbi:glycosyltransferase family 2 protein [Tundrisphaera lichenicola]|uniref:glycosyltransferase family 2 protein n=1 Tax=Tundrisphaera lichenicola TaxID=2029860 RepID=UPI003EB8739E